MHGVPSLIVGWITSGVIRAEFVRSILALQTYRLEHWEFGGIIDQISPYIDDNRNMICSEFLERTKANWLLMIDIDMSFNPVAVDRLSEHARAGERIIAGIYHQFVPPTSLVPLSYVLNERDLYVPITLDGPTHIDGAPAGFLLMHREPLEKMQATEGNNWFTRIPTNDGRHYGEDLSFCRRAKLHGYKVLGVPKLEIRHLKVVPI